MSVRNIDDVDRLKRINKALMDRVERATDQQHNAFSLFQTALYLEGQVKQRTDELSATMRSLELSNVEFARQKEISENANLSKTRFLAAASHDVLQPLHAAQLVASTLAEVQESEEGSRLVEQLERSLDTMHELLQTLLDISRLDAGVVVPVFESVCVQSLVESLFSDFRPIAEKKGLRLRAQVANVYVWSDRKMLRRALQNLISNGLHYTTNGGVLVGTRLRGEQIILEIVDTGCGIPPDQEEHIFEEFHRGAIPRNSDGRRNTGLGLGLSIVRRLVGALGHSLDFVSTEGRGTRFRLSAAATTETSSETEAKPVPTPDQVSEALTGTRVLLIENEPNVVEAMTGLLSLWGCEMKVAPACNEAIAQIADWTPDVIIADQHLDRGGLGTEIIRIIQGKFDRPLPAIVVTADWSEAVLAKSGDIGVEVMHKPIKPAQLRALICHLVAPKSHITR